MSVNIEIKNNVGIVSLDRPGTNSLSLPFLTEIYETTCDLEQHKNLQIIIFESALNFGFSSGLDLGSFFMKKKRQTAENIYNAVNLVFLISQKILFSPLVYIASIHGGVIGSAITLMASCDLRIAADNSWLWVPDPRYRGLLAEGGIEIMRELIGTSRTAMLNLTTDRFDAETVNDWGVFYKVFKRNELRKKTIKIAERLSDYSIDSLRQTKIMINTKIKQKFEGEMFKEFLSPEKTEQWLQPYMSSKKKHE